MRLTRAVVLFCLATCTAWGAVRVPQSAPEPLGTCRAALPYGTPFPASGTTVVQICRKAYLSGYDLYAKIPAWVAYQLTPDHSIGCLDRSNAFAADQSLPKEYRALPADYANSGYDMGHVAPDGDMSWSVEVERQSFLLSNMTPQLPGLNRVSWKALEDAVRAWTYVRGDNLVIYDGPVYDIHKDKKIGNGVDVPTAFFKIVVDTKTREVQAFLFQNAADQGTDLSKFKVSLTTVANLTGIVFPLPASYTESDQVWPENISVYNIAKKQKCNTGGK